VQLTSFPHKIKFLSDSTEIEFVKEIKDAKVKERIANYIFTKGEVNEGKLLSLFLVQIEKLLQDKLIEV